MNKLFSIFATLLLTSLSQNSWAVDAGCEAIIASTEARLKMPAWHSISETSKQYKLEAIKVDGKFYSMMGKGKWVASPVNFDEAEQKFLQQVRDGNIKLSQCKDVGIETVEGVDTRVVSYHIDIKGGPSADAKLYIGKADGLPYASNSATTKTRFIIYWDNVAETIGKTGNQPLKFLPALGHPSRCGLIFRVFLVSEVGGQLSSCLPSTAGV